MTLLDHIDVELDRARQLVEAATSRLDRLARIRELAQDLDGAREGAGDGATDDPVGAIAMAPADNSCVSATSTGALPRAADHAPARDQRPAGQPAAATESVAAAGDGDGTSGDRPGGTPGPAPSPAGRIGRQLAANTGPVILAALRDLGEATIPQIAEHIDANPSTIHGRVLRFVDNEEIVAVGFGERDGGTNGRRPRKYALKTAGDRRTAKQGTRGTGTGPKRGQSAGAQVQTYVLACIREGAGLVDEPEIAAQLELDPEQVAAACGQLLQDGLVALNADGTYTSTGGGPR